MAPVAGRRRIEEITHHPLGEFATVSRILDRGRDLDSCNPSLRGDPEPHLVTPTPSFAWRAGGGKDGPPRRSGENVTRVAARARTGIRAHAGARARSRPPTGAGALSRSTGGTHTGRARCRG